MKAVAEANIDANEGLYETLDSREGIMMKYKLAKTKHRRSLGLIVNTLLMRTKLYSPTLMTSTIGGNNFSTTC